jgi:capsid protein
MNKTLEKTLIWVGLKKPTPTPAPRQKTLADFPGLVSRNIMTVSFNGEKNVGGAGPMVDYKMDYFGLRARSWAAQIESDIAQIGINRLLTWVVGRGLKPQVEPVTTILNDNGITIDQHKFSQTVETRFNLWRNTTMVDYSGMKNLNTLSWDVEKNAMVGGDVLIVLRVKKGALTVQIIDGSNVVSPDYGNEYFPKELANGHSLVDGIEMDEKRQHVAYYVKVYAIDASVNNLFQWKFERIEARPKSANGMLMAWLYYGNEYRINNVRGIPLIASCIEKLTKIDEYGDATLNQAKEAAKVDYQVVHNVAADGKAPWAKSTIDAFDTGGGGTNSMPITDDGEQLNKTVHITTIGTAYNNTPGSKIEMLENKNPLYFKDFYTTNADAFFAVISIPPNVAMGSYNDSFSASRAAIKDWEHTLSVKREKHINGFLKPIFNVWFTMQVLTNKIAAPGFIEAFTKSNVEVMQSYMQIRFVGAMVPHIDPLKEVRAAREKLGAAGVNMPLADLENVIESLGGGDANEVLAQFARELKKTNDLKIYPPTTEKPAI